MSILAYLVIVKSAYPKRTLLVSRPKRLKRPWHDRDCSETWGAYLVCLLGLGPATHALPRISVPFSGCYGLRGVSSKVRGAPFHFCVWPIRDNIVVSGCFFRLLACLTLGLSDIPLWNKCWLTQKRLITSSFSSLCAIL